MAIDPSILMGIRAPQFESPTESMAKALQVQNLMQAGQMNATKLRALQQEQADIEGIRQLMSREGAVDPMTGMPAAPTLGALMRYGPTGMEAASKAQKQSMENQKLRSEMRKAALQMTEQELTNYTLQAQKAVKLLGPDFDTLPDPDKATAWQMAVEGTPFAGAPLTPQNRSAIERGARTWQQMVDEQKWGAPQAMVPEGQQTPVMVQTQAQTGRTRQLPYGAPPPASAVSLTMGGMGATPADIERQALMYVQGRETRPKGREANDPVKRQGWMRAQQMDPSLNESTIEIRKKMQMEANQGKMGTSNNAIDTVLGHLGALTDTFSKMPDMGMRGANWAMESLKELGPGGNPLLQEVKDKVEAIGPEMSKAYVQGPGTREEREGWKERINPFRPMAERKSNLYTFASLLVTKLDANEKQYRKAFGGLSENAVPAPMQLSDQAYRTLKKIEAWTGRKIPGADKWIKRYEESASPSTTQAPEYRVPEGAIPLGAGVPDGTPVTYNVGGKRVEMVAKGGVAVPKEQGPTQVETRVNPANGRTYYRHPDGKFYLAPPK